MKLLLPLFSRLSSSSRSSLHLPSKRALSASSPSSGSSTTAFLSPPDLPPGLVLTHAKTSLAATQRAELAFFWFSEGFCPSEIAIALRPEKPYSIWTVRAYLVRHARDSILFRATLQFDQAIAATSRLRGKVQLNRLRLFDEGRYALLSVCEHLFLAGVRLKNIAKKIRVRLDTLRVFIFTLALLDPSVKSLVESQLHRLFQADKKGRFLHCSTFEEGCEVMKQLQDRLRVMAVFTDESVRNYELGIRIGGRMKSIRTQKDLGWEQENSSDESLD